MDSGVSHVQQVEVAAAGDVNVNGETVQLN